MSSFEENIESEEIESSVIEDDEEHIGSEISKSITVILKAVTHRGTQTMIRCDPNKSEEDFIDMIINMKI